MQAVLLGVLMSLCCLSDAIAQCAGCLLQQYATAGMPVTVTVTFGPLCKAGVCTGEVGNCSSTPCLLKNLTVRVDNTGANPVDITYYDGTWPILTGHPVTLGGNSWIRFSVGQANGPTEEVACGSHRVLVAAGVEDAGAKCSACE